MFLKELMQKHMPNSFIGKYQGKPFIIVSDGWSGISLFNKAAVNKMDIEQLKKVISGAFCDTYHFETRKDGREVVIDSLGKRRSPKRFLLDSLDDYATEEDVFNECVAIMLALDDPKEAWLYWGFGDQYTTCSNCGAVLRTDPEHCFWEPEFIRTDTKILCLKCAKIRRKNMSRKVIELDVSKKIQDAIELEMKMIAVCSKAEKMIRAAFEKDKERYDAFLNTLTTEEIVALTEEAYMKSPREEVVTSTLSGDVDAAAEMISKKVIEHFYEAMLKAESEVLTFTTKVLQHDISFYYDTRDYSDMLISELYESDREHIQTMIMEGYVEGELVYYDPKKEETFSGWWKIVS